MKIIFLFSLSLILSSCQEDRADSTHLLECSENDFSFEKAKYNLFLIAGQSNTHYGIGYDPAIDTAHGAALQLGRLDSNDMEIVPAKEPLEHYTPKENKIGFAIPFANLFQTTLLDEDDSTILIPASFGGSGFSNDQWNRGDPLYEDAVFRIKHLLDI
jgi:hypothetical protein